MHVSVAIDPPKTIHVSFSKSARLALAYSPALLFAVLAAGRGLPVLRHDWFTVSGRRELLQFTLSTLAWQPAGIGAVRVYPSDYLFAVANTLFAFVLGTHIGLMLYAALVGALCLYGARALAALEPNDSWSTFGLALFALFNPWVYVKLVAGHLAMIAAYGALMALVAELWRRQPRWHVAALLLAPMAQLQFFVLGMASCACAAVLVRTRASFLPLAYGVAFALPSLIGFAVDSGKVTSIRYNLDWQKGQSIAPIDAAALTGYFTNYSRGFPPLAFDAVWAVAALAVIGLFARFRLRNISLLAAAGLAWLLATGTKGPLASTYEVLVQAFPPILLFRELYDVLAVVALAYVGIAAVATGRFKILRRVAIAPGVVLVACWVASPPDSWWVERGELPRLSVDAPPNTRFALYPDIAPMRFGSSGSGTDPDAYSRFGNVTSVNGSDVQYPASVALRRYAQTGDAGALRVLGVSRIYGRTWLESDQGAAAGVAALPGSGAAGGRVKRIDERAFSIKGAPELSLVERIDVAPTLPALGSGQIFFGDVAGIAGPSIPKAWSGFTAIHLAATPREHLGAAKDWVDVRDAFDAEPSLGEAFGGSLTTSPTALLRIPGGGLALLVNVRGRLLSNNGHVLTGTTRGYAWIATPPGVEAVRCSGECVVVASGTPPAISPANDPRSIGLELHAPFPWFAWSTLPSRRSVTVLKYLVGYDTPMVALTMHGALPHVRMETAFNGWLVAGHNETLPVVIVDILSASQIVSECIGCALVLALGLRVVRTSRINSEIP